MTWRKGYKNTLADYSIFDLDTNTAANDAATPVWTNQLTPSGSGGAEELRFCASGAGTATTPSASWPGFQRPASVQAIPECWGFTTNILGAKVNTYDGTNANARQFRWDFDNLGTPVSPMQMSSFATTALPTPVPGTQPSSPSSDGSGIVNGHATDTSSKAYMKGNAFGVGLTGAGAQQTPSAGTTGTVTATSGTTGALTPGASAWLTNWQDLQGWTDYILSGATAQALTAGFWFFVLSLWSGPNLCLGTNIGPVIVNQYNYT